MQLAKVEVQDTVMIGDNLLADIGGAQNIGMDVIYYNEHHKIVPENIPQVTTLLDIKSLL